MNIQVPNQFPTLDGGVAYRIALIGEAPGADEVVAGTPFVGVSGRWLDYLLNRTGIMRSACFLGNVCQQRPPNNKFELFDWKGKEIQDGLKQLQDDLYRFNPNLCVLLGGQALRAAKGYPESISNWRGSLFESRKDSAFDARKCLATFHPASSLRVYEQTPLLLFDLKRARHEGERRELLLPRRTIKVLKSVGEVQLELRRMRENKRKIGTDIEGYVNNLTCISFSDDPLCGYVIPFTGTNANYWSEEDEYVVWLEVKALLEDPTVPKVLQNGLYDRFVLAYSYGILVRGVSDDTMLKHWEVYCELQKRLSLQASIYTKEPYYKDERTTDDWEEFWQYSGKDSCVTLEISNFLDTIPELRGAALEHYKFNVAMQNPLLYMELRGMLNDQSEAQKTAVEIRQEVFQLQHLVNKAAGCALSVQAEGQVFALVKENMCIKRTPTVFSLLGLQPYLRKPFEQSYQRVLQLAAQGYPFDDKRNGEFSMLLEKHLNTDSSQQMCLFLYTLLALPVQLNKDTKNPTADALALLKLYKKTENPILRVILKLSSLLTQLQTLDILCDPDGRIRCAYNVVGSQTGRLSCSKSPTRSGYNLQTVTKKQRRVFRPDPEHFMWQCDGSGADGWTVAAHCKRLGDSTMLEDYLFGLKPARIIARMYEGSNVNILPRDQIKEDCKKVDDKGWLYMGAKRVQHGTSYDMGKLTMSNQILEDSWKYGGEPTFVPPNVCEDLQILFYQRYPGVQVRKRHIAELLKQSRTLLSANGHTRRFFGRPTDPQTLRDALADEPQNVTTYVTNMGILKLWNDPENREADGWLKIEPLHQMHDAAIGQFHQSIVEWAVPRIRYYFDNQIIIQGEPIRIPFEGGYGLSWSPSDLNHPI